MQPFYPVILCGGSGSRLWPMSRKLFPKQFLALASDRSLLQETVLRVRDIDGAAAPIVVSNDDHRFLVAEQMREIGVTPGALVLEPVGRNTAPAVGVAALCALERDPGAVIAVLPSDHRIGDPAAFRGVLAEALAVAAGGPLVTFGIVPRRAATGYGYMERAEPVPGRARAFRVARFVEKPDRDTAARYVDSGRFRWNSGMFVFRARRFLEELERLRPDVLAAVQAAWKGAVRDLDFLRLDAAAFAACPSVSVDYAVMEHSDATVMIEADIGWNDLGSWSELWEIGAKDAAGNVVQGDVDLCDSSGCYVRAESRLVSVLGASDLAVVETADAVLVAAKGRVQEVKEIVERLHRGERTEHVSHRRVYRPWGYYERIDAGEGFQVKRIMVKPGAALSLQLHRHRAEHWVVVSGTARVTRGDEILTLRENESTFIPVGHKHRLENRGEDPLYLIEVQSGRYLDESDIVRLEDRYNRT